MSYHNQPGSRMSPDIFKQCRIITNRLQMFLHLHAFSRRFYPKRLPRESFTKEHRSLIITTRQSQQSGGLGPDLRKMGTRRTKAPHFFHRLSIIIPFNFEGVPLNQDGGWRPSGFTKRLMLIRKMLINPLPSHFEGQSWCQNIHFIGQ